MWITILKPRHHRLRGVVCSWPVCTVESHQNATLTLTEQTCSYAVIMAIFTNGVTIVEKSDKPQLSNQWAQKISLFVDDPSTTSWRKSQEDLPPLCLHNRGHKGENIASYRTSSRIPFFIIITLYLITADNCLV